MLYLCCVNIRESFHFKTLEACSRHEYIMSIHKSRTPCRVSSIQSTKREPSTKYNSIDTLFLPNMRLQLTILSYDPTHLYENWIKITLLCLGMEFFVFFKAGVPQESPLGPRLFLTRGGLAKTQQLSTSVWHKYKQN